MRATSQPPTPMPTMVASSEGARVPRPLAVEAEVVIERREHHPGHASPSLNSATKPRIGQRAGPQQGNPQCIEHRAAQPRGDAAGGGGEVVDVGFRRDQRHQQSAGRHAATTSNAPRQPSGPAPSAPRRRRPAMPPDSPRRRRRWRRPAAAPENVSIRQASMPMSWVADRNAITPAAATVDHRRGRRSDNASRCTQRQQRLHRRTSSRAAARTGRNRRRRRVVQHRRPQRFQRVGRARHCGRADAASESAPSAPLLQREPRQLQRQPGDEPERQHQQEPSIPPVPIARTPAPRPSPARGEREARPAASFNSGAAARR